LSRTKADIRAWLDSWNQNPRSLAWTKTADEILESIARHWERINDLVVVPPDPQSVDTAIRLLAGDRLDGQREEAGSGRSSASVAALSGR
jgi:hypothetical protein